MFSMVAFIFILLFNLLLYFLSDSPSSVWFSIMSIIFPDIYWCTMILSWNSAYSCLFFVSPPNAQCLFLFEKREFLVHLFHVVLLLDLCEDTFFCSRSHWPDMSSLHHLLYLWDLYHCSQGLVHVHGFNTYMKSLCFLLTQVECEGAGCIFST